MGNQIEEPLDVQVEYPIVPPAALARRAHGIVGDVDPAAYEVAGWVSPNPGGVGPMTRAMLLANVVETAERLHP